MEGQKDTESPPSDASTTSTVSPDVNKADDSTSVPDKNVEIRPSPLAEFKALSPKPGVQIQCEKDEGCSVVPPGDSFPAAPFGAPNKVVDVNFGAFAEPSKQRRLFYELSFWVRTMYFLYKDYAINSLRTFPALLCVAALFSGMLALLTYVEKTSISDVEAIGMSWLFFWIFVIPWEWLTLYTQVKQADSLKQKHEPKMTLSRFLLGIVLPSGLALAASLAIFIKHADVTDLATYVWSFPVHYTIYLIVRIISKNHLADRKPFNTKTVIAGLVEALVCSIIYCFSDMMFCLFFYADAVMLTTWDGWGALFVCVCYGAYMYLFTCLYHLVLIPASLRSFKNLDAAEKRQLHVMSAYSTQVFFGLPEVLLSYTCPSMKIFFLGAVIVEISAYMTKQTILKGNLPQDGHDEFGVDIIEDASEYGTSLGKIEIVSISVFHLPKMDTIGSCDPYLMVQIGPRESKTSVRMRSIDASWSEPMIFDLLTLPNGDIPSMRVKCMDRDRGGTKDDFVGQYTITGESLMKIPPGRMVGDKSNTIWVEMLRENGERRIGMDNQVTTVKIDLRRYLPVSEDTLGSIRIVSMAVSNLPKTDRFGLSDPFMVIRMGDVESKTPIKKRKLHAKWTQEIDLDLGAGTPAMNPSLQVDVFDWNLVGTDERVGSTEVTVAELMKLPAMGKPLELKKALGLPSPVGGQRLVTGQDGEAAECILEILRFGPVAPLVVKRKEIRSPQCRPSQHSARPSPMQPPPRDGPKPPRLNDVSEDGKPPPLGEEQGSPRASPAPAELSIHTVPQPPPDNVSTSSGNKPASSSAEISRQPSSVIQRSPSAMQRAKSGMGEAARALGRTLTKAASRRFHITPADHFVTYEEIADALGEGIESALESAGARMLRVPSKEGSGFARNASSVLRARSTEHRGQSGVGRTVSVEVERVKKVELGVNEVTGAAEQEIEVDNEEPKMSREQIMASKLDMFAGSDLAMIGSHVFAAMMLIMVWVFVQTDDFDEFSGIIPWTETLTRFGIGIAMMSLSDALQAPAIEKRFPEMANEKERMLAMSSLRPLDWATAIFFIACVGSMFCFGWLAAV